MIDHDWFTTRDVAGMGRCTCQAIKFRAKRLGYKQTRILNSWVWTAAQARELSRTVKLGRPRKQTEGSK